MNDDKPMQTVRLVVRRFNLDDWKDLQQLAIDKKDTGGDRYDHAWPTDDKGAQEMAQWCVGRRCFAVCLKDSGQLIGFVRFNSIDDKGQLDLGHMFHSCYRGERYASEAIRPLLAVAFAEATVKGIVARNAVEWPGQLTPLIELGFGELERGQAPNFNGADGGPIGFVACRMGLTRTEWEASKTADSMTHFLLEGDTLHIGFHPVGKAPYPEDIVPAGVLRALSQQLKTDLQTQGIFWGDYCYFAGISGEAFRFEEFMNLTGPATGRAMVERYGNMTVPELYRTPLQAAGYDCRVYLKDDPPDQASLQQQIVQSLRDRQTPVIGLGVFSPREEPGPFLITGYDESGAVLLGWSHFQGDKKAEANISFEPGGQFRLSNWYGVIDGVIIVTGKAQRPAVRDIYRDAIERAICELRTTQGIGGALGTAAMEKWAVHLEADAEPEVLSAEQMRHHGVTAGDLAERRALAASFIELAIRALPKAKNDLALAQAAFQGSHDTVYEIWETIARKGPFDPDLEKFADPARRHTMAMLVRRLADFDRRGLACLERALKIVDGKEPGEPIPANTILDGDAVLEKVKAPPGEPPIWAPENIHIANSLSMLQAFLGEEVGQLNEVEKSHRKLSYVLWMGYSGAAFGMLADGPERANLPLVFDALGYDYELWMNGELVRETGLPARDWGWDDNLRRRIFWNLRDCRLPVLLFGCGKWPDWWLVTQVRHWGDLRGYGGKSGEGYRPNEPLDDPRNPLRKIHLMDTMKGKQTWTINLTGKRPGDKPSMEELYRRAIEWGAKQIRGLRMKLLNNQGQEYISADPYKDWARMMTAESLFPPGDPETLKARRSFLEGAEVELAERRYYGAAFLDMAAIRLNRPELKQAAEHFRNVNRLMEQVWAQTGGLHAADGHLKYAAPDVRDRIADFLLEIGGEEAAAVLVLDGSVGRNTACLLK